MTTNTLPPHEDSDAFYKLCVDLGVNLDPEVFTTANNLVEDGIPTGILSAVKNAGEALREDPDRVLTDSLINPDWGFSTNVSTRTLIEILNSSLEKSPIPSHEVQFTCSPAEKLDTCSFADLSFLRTIVTVEYVSPDQPAAHGCQIIANQAGSPIFVRKYLGNPSAISLKDVYINGIPYPAGSIFSLEAPDDEDSLPEPSSHKVQEIPLRNIGRISFLRLSAFALPPAERRAAKFHIDKQAQEVETDYLLSAELTDLYGSALDALEQLREDELLPQAANF